MINFEIIHLDLHKWVSDTSQSLKIQGRPNKYLQQAI